MFLNYLDLQYLLCLAFSLLSSPQTSRWGSSMVLMFANFIFSPNEKKYKKHLYVLLRQGYIINYNYKLQWL